MAAGLIAISVTVGTTRGSSGPAPADVAFVHHMVPHHELGLRMTDLALRNAHDVRVREIGFEMSGYQGRELVILRSLGDRWPQETTGHAVEPAGMLDGAEEASLAGASGPAFDHLWLDLMIRHHEGAVTMAADELARGRSGTVRSIAAAILNVQTRQIDQMRTAKAALGSDLG